MNSWFNINIPVENLHPQFKWLLDIGYKSERQLVESWIEDFSIKDGLDKTITEFQSTFRSVFWELYLNQVFKFSGLRIDSAVKSPDFLLRNDSNVFSVEAVVANFSNSGIEEKERNFRDIYDKNDIYEIINVSIPRLLNAIEYKSKTYYSRYVKCDLVATNPFIIAVADFGQIKYGQVAFYSMLAVLYHAAYDPEDKLELNILCDDNFGNEYKYIPFYTKENGSKISIGLFSDNKNEHISAILFTCTLTLGKLTSLTETHTVDRFVYLEREHTKTIRYSGSKPDETLCDGLFLFINPYAKYPLSKQILKGQGLTVITADFENEQEILIECENSSPLIRRKVGMRGDEYIYIKDIENFYFYRVKSET